MTRLATLLVLLALPAMAGPGTSEFQRFGLGQCLDDMEFVRPPSSENGVQTGEQGVLSWCSYAVHLRKEQGVRAAFEAWSETALASKRYLRTGAWSFESNGWREPVMEVVLEQSAGALVLVVRDLDKES